MATIAEYITEEGSAVARTVFAFKHSDGVLAGSVTSDAGTGEASITVATTDKHYIVALDDESGSNYNAVCKADITPT